MIPVEFDEVNVFLGKGQEEYETLPAFWDGKESMTMCFQLNKEEIEEINRTGKLWMKQLTFGSPFQPILLGTMREDVFE